MERLKNEEALAKLRESLRKKYAPATAPEVRVIVGMGTCGIAAGARDVTDALR